MVQRFSRDAVEEPSINYVVHFVLLGVAGLHHNQVGLLVQSLDFNDVMVSMHQNETDIYNILARNVYPIVKPGSSDIRLFGSKTNVARSAMIQTLHR